MKAPIEIAIPTPDGELSALSEQDLDLLLLIRHLEEALLHLFAEGKLHGTTHSCLGQEYIPVALRALLRDDDFIFSNHRGHGHYLARFDDPLGLLAEVMGRSGGVCNGVGGSQHLYRDGFLSTGIQGESVPIGAGVALHYKRRGRQQLVLVYIGDGTWGQGAVYEALNLAQLWRLPLLVVVENNHIAQSTPTNRAMAGTIADRARAFGLAYEIIQTDDVTGIRRQLAPVIAEVRAASAPAVVEFDTVRLAAHSKGDDTREPDELFELRSHDWYVRYRTAFPERFGMADKRQQQKVTELVDLVESWPYARGEA
jgi:pyruvate dehydrogenase E1 component alpha subunit